MRDRHAQPAIHQVTAGLPWMSVGFLIAAVYFVFEVAIGISDPTALDDPYNPFLFTVGLVGWIYWLYCVYEIHLVLAEATRGSHPISPGRAFWSHFIPIYNLYWQVYWPAKVIELVNARSESRQLAKGGPGFFLLLALPVGYLLDSALALVVIFSVGVFLNGLVRQTIAASSDGLDDDG